jgi:hypothetical protein
MDEIIIEMYKRNIRYMAYMTATTILLLSGCGVLCAFHR